MPCLVLLVPDRKAPKFSGVIFIVALEFVEAVVAASHHGMAIVSVFVIPVVVLWLC